MGFPPFFGLAILPLPLIDWPKCDGFGHFLT